MKKMMLILVWTAVLLLAGCAEEKLPPMTSQPGVPAETGSWVQTEVQEETEPSGDRIYLNVSEIDLSLVGDSEDLYAGSAPRNRVTFQSADPAVATFEDGVLTAVGVGETTVSAVYEDQKIQVPVSCLAETKEALRALPAEILKSPKRLPPPVSQEPATCFNDAAIIGDSITFVLFQNELRSNGLGDILFLAKGGISLNSLVLGYKKLSSQGKDRPVEDLLQETGVRKVFIMLGQNDLNYMDLEPTVENLRTLVKRIRKKNPEIQIYLESCTPQYLEKNGDSDQNALIDAFNLEMKDYADLMDLHYVEVEKYIENHCNNMAEIYHNDNRHMNPRGCEIWIQALKAHMDMEALQAES